MFVESKFKNLQLNDLICDIINFKLIKIKKFAIDIICFYVSILTEDF